MKKVQSVAKYLIEGMRLYIIVLVFLQKQYFLESLIHVDQFFVISSMSLTKINAIV
jgi:hypothetical protein